MNFSRPVAWIASFNAVSTASVPLLAKCVIVGEGTCSGDVGMAPDGHFHPNKPPGASLLVSVLLRPAGDPHGRLASAAN